MSTSIFFYEDGTLSVRQNGQSVEAESVAIFKSDGGYVLKLTELGGKTTEFSRSGARELAPAGTRRGHDQVQIDIEHYFERLDDEG